MPRRPRKVVLRNVAMRSQQEYYVANTPKTASAGIQPLRQPLTPDPGLVQTVQAGTFFVFHARLLVLCFHPGSTLAVCCV